MISSLNLLGCKPLTGVGVCRLERRHSADGSGFGAVHGTAGIAEGQLATMCHIRSVLASIPPPSKAVTVMVLTRFCNIVSFSFCVISVGAILDSALYPCDGVRSSFRRSSILVTGP